MEHPVKTYILGYNRYDGKVITYSTIEHAESSGTWWRAIEAIDHKEAKSIFLEMYNETHEEHE
jgi:hypothetical protein